MKLKELETRLNEIFRDRPNIEKFLRDNGVDYFIADKAQEMMTNYILDITGSVRQNVKAAEILESLLDDLDEGLSNVINECLEKHRDEIQERGW